MANVWTGLSPFPLENSSNVVSSSATVEGQKYSAVIDHPAGLPSESFRLRDSNMTYGWVGGSASTQTVIEFTAERVTTFIQMNNKAISGTATIEMFEVTAGVSKISTMSIGISIGI